MIPSDTHKKMMSAFQLLDTQNLSLSSFNHVVTILKGIHPELDKKLEVCEVALDKFQKIQSGDMISLSAESLPEESEEQKKRKKALLFFIQSIKDLKSEIKRVEGEFKNSQNNSSSQTMWHIGRIIKFAKGPFGVITLIALVIIGFSFIFLKNSSKPVRVSIQITPTPTIFPSNMQKGIIYNGKQIPLSQLYIGHGSDCDAPHYHAVTGFVVATDGTKFVDPEGCGFGKVASTQVIAIPK